QTSTASPFVLRPLGCANADLQRTVFGRHSKESRQTRYNKCAHRRRGEVLSQALDARLIDKVQLYLGPILTGGPVIAFAGRGATNAANALRLRRVSYQRIGQSVCIT